MHYRGIFVCYLRNIVQRPLCRQELFFHFVFSKISLLIIAGTAVLGFFLSFNKMVDIFGSLWGTNAESGIGSTGKFVIMVVFALAFVAVVVLLRQ